MAQSNITVVMCRMKPVVEIKGIRIRKTMPAIPKRNLGDNNVLTIILPATAQYSFRSKKENSNHNPENRDVAEHGGKILC